MGDGILIQDGLCMEPSANCNIGVIGVIMTVCCHLPVVGDITYKEYHN